VKNLTALLTLMVIWTCAFVSPARAEEPAEAKEIRVLLTYGGHDFQEEPFFAMFDKLKGISYTRAPMPKSIDMLKPGLQKQFDVIVMYDMVSGLTPEQKKAFTELLGEGIGLVSLHHNLGAHRDWPEFTKIIGGKFFFEPHKSDGKQLPKSGWAHGQDIDVTIADKDHPITRGLKKFRIHDETYNKYFVAADVRVLLETDHAKSDPQLGWVKQYGKSRVFHLMLGHDAGAWKDANFTEILQRGIRWTSGRSE
jgi:type 1 glutamine amidotransferase